VLYFVAHGDNNNHSLFCKKKDKEVGDRDQITSGNAYIGTGARCPPLLNGQARSSPKS